MLMQLGQLQLCVCNQLCKYDVETITDVNMT